MNTNCLEGIHCPGCGSHGYFRILASAWVDVTDEGVEDNDGFEWDNDNACECGECGYSATVGDFRDEKTND